MGIYIFPIFLFGCTITAIVLMAVQQAADWAKDEAARKIPSPSVNAINESVTPELNFRQSNGQPESAETRSVVK